MKKIIFMIPIILVLLSGCGKSEYDIAYEKANVYFAQNNYKEGLKYFEQAMSLEPDKTELNEELQEHKDAYYSYLIEKGNKAFSDWDYNSAVDYYGKAIKDVGSNPAIKKEYENALKKANDYNILVEYTKWYKPQLEQLITLSNDWSYTYQAALTGKIDQVTVKAKSEQYLEQSSKLLIDAQQKYFQLDRDLAKSHQEFIAIVTNVKNDSLILYNYVNVVPPENYNPNELDGLFGTIADDNNEYLNHLNENAKSRKLNYEYYKVVKELEIK
jgi:hypothetical protein